MRDSFGEALLLVQESRRFMTEAGRLSERENGLASLEEKARAGLALSQARREGSRMTSEAHAALTRCVAVAVLCPAWCPLCKGKHHPGMSGDITQLWGAITQL